MTTLWGYGIASFDLEPAGAGSCRLDMPAGYRLLQVRVNDGPAVVNQVAPNQWNISGGATRLPQRIEVVFVVDREDDADAPAETVHPAPSLVGFAVDHTLWSVLSPRDSRLTGEDAGPASISPTRCRIDSIPDRVRDARIGRRAGVQ